MNKNAMPDEPIHIGSKIEGLHESKAYEVRVTILNQRKKDKNQKKQGICRGKGAWDRQSRPQDWGYGGDAPGSN